MKFILYAIATVLLLLGAVFVIAGASPPMAGRIIVGCVLVIGAAALIVAARLQPQVKQVTVTEKLDITGDISLEELKCRSCGGALAKENFTAKEGAIFVRCPYCSATYQVEEAPKW
jgi:Zn finger protein HypA/HybF involved in hydrogenase expression